MTRDELYCTLVVEIDIVETPGSIPFSMRPYRTNAEGRKTICKIVKEWKDLGVATKATSDYADPVLVGERKIEKTRIVVNYRRLNAQAGKEKYSLPNIDVQFEGLAGATLYTVLDTCNYP